MLRYKGHEYHVKKANKDGSCAWRCGNFRKFKCTVTMSTNGDLITREPGHHCHETDPVGSKAKEVKVGIKQDVQVQPDVATRQVVGRALGDVSPEVMIRLPSRRALCQSVQIQRRRQGGQLDPNPQSRNFAIPGKYRNLVQHDSGENDNNRILILGDQDLIRQLNDASLWFADGTFDSSPLIFYQLYSIHCKVGSSYPACVYVLLPNKNEDTYNRMHDYLINNVMINPNPNRYLVDFELAAINSVRRFFPNCEVSCCYFHLNQSLVRKVGQLGLKRRFDEDMDFKLLVKSLTALSFVPVVDIDRIFNRLVEVWPDDERCADLLGYFDGTYVRGIRPRLPRYPLELWNHYEAAAEKGPRTTNCCEGFHNALNSHFLCQHPSIWKLFDGLKEDININKLTLAHAQTGVEDRRPKKYVVLAQRVAAAINGYAAEPDKLKYLRRLAALQ